MAKRSGRHLSKKGLIGLKRITNKEGKRVWNYLGQEFPTLRSVVLFHYVNNISEKRVLTNQ